MKNKSVATTDQPSSGLPAAEMSDERSHWWRVFIFIVITILTVGLGLWIHQQHMKKVVFNVNGKNYQQKEVHYLTDFSSKLENIPYATESKTVYELLKYKAAAEAIGITFTDAQLKQYRSQTDGTKYQKKSYEAFLNLAAFKNRTEEYLAKDAVYNKDGYFEGYSFVFRFDESITNFPTYKSPYYGDKALYEKDKKHATDKAKRYRTMLMTHKITADKALAEIKADPKLGYFYKANTNDSAKFGTAQDSNWRREIFHPEIASFVTKQTKPGITAIQTVKVAAVINPKTPSDFADGYYYFVLLSKLQPPIKNPQQALQKSLDTVSKHSKYNGASNE